MFRIPRPDDLFYVLSLHDLVESPYQDQLQAMMVKAREISAESREASPTLDESGPGGAIELPPVAPAYETLAIPPEDGGIYLASARDGLERHGDPLPLKSSSGSIPASR